MERQHPGYFWNWISSSTVTVSLNPNSGCGLRDYAASNQCRQTRNDRWIIENLPKGILGELSGYLKTGICQSYFHQTENAHQYCLHCVVRSQFKNKTQTLCPQTFPSAKFMNSTLTEPSDDIKIFYYQNYLKYFNGIIRMVVLSLLPNGFSPKYQCGC